MKQAYLLIHFVLIHFVHQEACCLPTKDVAVRASTRERLLAVDQVPSIEVAYGLALEGARNRRDRGFHAEIQTVFMRRFPYRDRTPQIPDVEVAKAHRVRPANVVEGVDIASVPAPDRRRHRAIVGRGGHRHTGRPPGELRTQVSLFIEKMPHLEGAFEED